jgi:hypothetical protein
MLKPGRDVSGLSKDLIDEGRRLAGEPPPGHIRKNANDESPVVLHSVPHDATGSYRPYEAVSTGDTPTGFAKAYGFEKIAAEQSAFARLANSGYRAFEDLANRLAGDYGVRFARAERFEAPEPSAALAAGKWQAMAGDAASRIRNAHARYLTGGSESIEVAGLNVRSTLAGVGDTFRGLFNRERGDGKMTFQQFKEEVFKAHRADKIEHSIPEVEEAAKAILLGATQSLLQPVAARSILQTDREQAGSLVRSRVRLVNSHRLRGSSGSRHVHARSTAHPEAIPERP